VRVNPNPIPDVLASIAETQKQENTALQQMASGRKINSPQDDPSGAALLTQIYDRSSQNDSFLKTMNSVTGQLQTADAALSSVVSSLQRAISLAVQGGTGTLTDSDRAALVEELTGIRDQLVSVANTSYQGQYLFSGTSVKQPFVADATAPSGVRYDGNDGVNAVAIGSGYPLRVNVPGSQIFSNAGSDVFQSLNDLITSLQGDTGIDAAVTGVTNAYRYVTGQRVFYGNALNQINSQQGYLSNVKLQLQQQENTTAAADLSQVASQLVNAENARNATLSAMAKISQNSLFDYLK
jgi:flagellar hook-associated protein 3 FlgL